MDLSTYKFPKVTWIDFAFSTLNVDKELLDEAIARGKSIENWIRKFDELFFKGGGMKFQSDVEWTWKEDAIRYARCLMGSFNPKHEEKQLVCGMIFQECLIF